MKVTAELSVYPLREDFKVAVLSFIEELLKGQDIVAVTNSMSTQLSGEDEAAIGARYEGRGYGYLKKDLVDAVEATLGPIRAEYGRITDDPAELDRILDAGAARARSIATPVLHRAMTNAGLGR